MTNKTKTKQRERVNNDSFEHTESLKKGLVDSFKNDVLKASAHDFWEQLLTAKGEKTREDSGELREGEEIIFNKKDVKKEARIEAGIDYAREIIHAERRIRAEDNQQLVLRIEEIVIELKKLAKSSKTLETQFRQVATVTMPKSPGKYHHNFFEWMFTIVKTARVRVESAEQWLKAIAGKGKKKDFWGLYKKHGTSFGLSSERAVAQQTG